MLKLQKWEPLKQTLHSNVFLKEIKNTDTNI